MIFQPLLEFNYANRAVLEYFIVFFLQIILYASACGLISLLVKLFDRLNIGSRIELRKNYPNQFFVDLKGSTRTCAIVAGYIYISFSFIKQLYPPDFMTAFYHVSLFIVLYDLYMYVTHRLLHTPALRRFHSVHHKSVSTTPWSCINMHTIEALINYLPFLLFAYFTSVSLVVFLGIHIYLIFGIANGHSNYNIFSNSLKGSMLAELSTFHQRHHSNGRGNYGYLFTHYDWLLGTRQMDEKSLKKQL